MIISIDTEKPLSADDRTLLRWIMDGTGMGHTADTVREPDEHDGSLMDAAVSLATRLMAEGKKTVVKDALAAIGGTQVSQLDEEGLTAFLDALADA